jgi:hypothetical protein
VRPGTSRLVALDPGELGIGVDNLRAFDRQDGARRRAADRRE